jgi:hypothetical protein
MLQGQVWQGLNRDLTGIKMPYRDKIRHLALQIPKDPSRDFKVLSLTEFSLGMIGGVCVHRAIVRVHRTTIRVAASAALAISTGA